MVTIPDDKKKAAVDMPGRPISKTTVESNSSKKKNISPRLRVVISCVTFETVKVVKPILNLRAEKVYILHYNNSAPNGSSSIYGEFYQEVVRQLLDSGLKGCDIFERNLAVYRFKDVLTELITIMTSECSSGNEVYVNISAGTMEFAAAATIASMMVEGVRPFTVHTRGYTISGDEQIKRAFYIDGKPVGQTKDVAEPVELPTFPIDMPPKDLVVALRILRVKKASRLSTKYTSMVQAIKEAGVWNYDPEREGRVKDKCQAEKMYYSRHYIDGWIKNGWVSGKEGRGRELQITDSGINITDIFFLST